MFTAIVDCNMSQAWRSSSGSINILLTFLHSTAIPIILQKKFKYDCVTFVFLFHYPICPLVVLLTNLLPNVINESVD